MSRTVAIGAQDFARLIENNNFYIDKTAFIRKWWNNDDSVTLITRPRRFGKTLTMSMVNCFFSTEYRNRGDLFERLEVWKDEGLRNLQGTYPVMFLTFAGIKYDSFEKTKTGIYYVLSRIFNDYRWLTETGQFSDEDLAFFHSVKPDMSENVAAISLQILSGWLARYFGKPVIILLDEYDTPMQEAYIHGFWDELTGFMRMLLNNTFKTNPALGRAIMTGITRISRESLFSDLNNLTVITATSDLYADAFGFTEPEVFAAMDEMGLAEKDLVKKWYDGFTFGSLTDIYNPWSITNYLKFGKLDLYWANTSSNGLVSKLIREGDADVKSDFETLLRGECLKIQLEEEVVFSDLYDSPQAMWSLLVAGGYLKIVSFENASDIGTRHPTYEIAITNLEVRAMFERMISRWFDKSEGNYNQFIRALLQGDVRAMNHYMNRVALRIFSYFDTGVHPSESELERFYHGFVLGLMVELQDRYEIRSNRESGFGRYDVVMRPKRVDMGDDAFILEFKVRGEEASLEETVEVAHRQIEEKHYAEELLAAGVPGSRIRAYGLAFEGKRVLIG